MIATDEILGQGAWGDVCRGLYNGEDVAIKYIRWNGDPQELRSLQHELTVLARLKVLAGHTHTSSQLRFLGTLSMYMVVHSVMTW